MTQPGARLLNVDSASLAFNMLAARAIGLTIPPQVLARADEVVDTAP